MSRRRVLEYISPAPGYVGCRLSGSKEPVTPCQRRSLLATTLRNGIRLSRDNTRIGRRGTSSELRMNRLILSEDRFFPYCSRILFAQFTARACPAGVRKDFGKVAKKNVVDKQILIFTVKNTAEVMQRRGGSKIIYKNMLFRQFITVSL